MVVGRLFARQGSPCPTGSIQRSTPSGGVVCQPMGPRMVGAALLPTPPGPSCDVVSFLAEKSTEGVASTNVSHAGALGTLAAALGLGGGVAGLMLAGRPFAGALLGLGAGVAVGAYRYASWRDAGGSSRVPGTCETASPYPVFK
jgi:hypothetical protein